MKKKSGFTLIEVLAVIIIIGVLAIIAVPAVTKYISRSNDSVYASDAFAFTENVRSKYEMGEYGDYLKDNEIMIVPIRTVVLEKGNEEESPYGAYEFEKSYVIIVPEDNQYKFYVNILDETNTGIINVPANSLDKSSVMQDIQAEIPTVSSFEITGTIYRLNGKEYKKIETREIIGDDVHDEDSAKAYVFKDITMDDNPSIVYNITLNNKGATVAGTSNIYELYTVGWYSDAYATSRIQTITPPTRNGYAFGGYYTQDNGGGKQVINAVGYINANTTSTFTSDGTLYAKWTECGKGYYSQNSLTCSICPEGYRDGTDVSTKTSEGACIKSVPAGRFVGSSGAVNVSTCATNTYSNPHTVKYGATSSCPACTSLGSGYTKSAGGTGESGCYMTVTAGKYVKNEKDPTATKCAANSYSGDHTVYYGNKSICSLCINLGTNYKKSAEGSSETGCYMTVPAGKYKTAAKGNSWTNCSANNYSIKHNSYYGSADNSCTGCPSGYSSVAGSTSKGACTITCSANTRVTAADGKCTGTCSGTQISQHTVNASNTSPACTACTNGTGVNAWGTGCTVNKCNANYYKNGNSCTACAGGTTTSAGNTATSCTACTNGTGVNAWGTGCTVNKCNANYYKNGNACTACAGGTTTSAGNTATSCTACTNGTGVNAWGTGCTVSTCKANYYKNGNGCSACPSGYSSAAGSTSISACTRKCGTGTYLQAKASSCTACPTDKYCGGGTYAYSSSNQGITGNYLANEYSSTTARNYGVAGSGHGTICNLGQSSGTLEYKVNCGNTSTRQSTISGGCASFSGISPCVTPYFQYRIIDQYGHNTSWKAVGLFDQYLFIGMLYTDFVSTNGDAPNSQVKIWVDASGTLRQKMKSVISGSYTNWNGVGVEAYVERLYNAVLDRGSDPGGKSDWVHWLNQGGYTRETAGHGFVDSKEGKANLAKWGHSWS